jgi:3-oxoacyl-[acyl-carrier protein] reductase
MRAAYLELMTAAAVELAGQVALVTGGGRGIGRRIAREVADAGMRVAVCSRSGEQVAQVAEEVGGLAVVADVTDAADVDRMVATVERELGPIALLVNNAGIILREDAAWEIDADDWWRVFEVNVLGVYLCCRATAPGMVARGSGRIVNVGGAAAWVPTRADSAYSSSKAAVYRFGETLAKQLAPYGVSVFTISPGLVRTAMTEGHYGDDAPWAEPELAAKLVRTLASGRADALSGRAIHAQLDDIEELIERAGEVLSEDLNAIRLRR